MKKIGNFSLLMVSLLSLCILMGCTKDNELTLDGKPSEIVDLNPENVLGDDALGVYTYFLDKIRHGNIKIDLIKVDENILGNVSAWHIDDLEHPKSVDGGNYFANDLQLNFSEVSNSYRLDFDYDQSILTDIIRHNFVGQEVRFRHTNNNGELTFDERLYLPIEMEILSLKGEKVPNSIFYRINRNDFSLKYTQDTDNNNGVLVILSYKGEFFGMQYEDFENLDQSSAIFKGLHFQNESESIKIPPALFDGIPKGGIVTLYLGRGNAREIRNNNQTYLVRALYEEQIRVIVE